MYFTAYFSSSIQHGERISINRLHLSSKTFLPEPLHVASTSRDPACVLLRHSGEPSRLRHLRSSSQPMPAADSMALTSVLSPPVPPARP